MIKIIIFSLSSYYLTKYLKNREIPYLFIGSLITALHYILEPTIIFLIPIYAAIFYFSCDEYCYRKRLSQFFVFIFPTIAAAFSLSYISWIYDRGFRLIYLSSDLFTTAVHYSGYSYRGIYQFLINMFSQMLIYTPAYILIFLWILFYKGITKPFIYVYLMPIFFQTARYMLIDFKADYRFYSVYLFYAFFNFIIFKADIRKMTKLFILIILIFNSALLAYQIISIKVI